MSGPPLLDVTIRIPVKPMATGNHHIPVQTADGRLRTIPSKKAANWMGTVTLFAQAAMAGRPPGTRPMSVDIVATFPMPTSRHLKSAIRGREPHAKTPDQDNLLDGIFDACNGVVWADDRLIWNTAIRSYIGAQDEQPHVRIRAWETTEDQFAAFLAMDQ